MQRFLFTAINSSGKAVDEFVQAENMSQARYFLEVRGYYDVRFYENDLSAQTRKLFDDHQIKLTSTVSAKKKIKQMRDTRLSRKLLYAAIIGIVSSAVFASTSYLNGNGIPYRWLAGFLVFDIYMLLPVILFDRVYQAYSWNRWSALRLWLKFARAFNFVSFNRIPAFEMDVYEASMEAKEKGVDTGIQRIARWRNHRKVTPQIFELGMFRIYNNARDFVASARILDTLCRQAGASTEMYVDYAVCLAWRHKRTRDARLVMEQAEKMPRSFMTDLAMPWAWGVIEFEDGNYDLAEFHLRQASKHQEEFRHNTMLEGVRSVVAGFLGVTLAKQGKTDEAQTIFEPARPFLTAVGESQLVSDFDALAK